MITMNPQVDLKSLAVYRETAAARAALRRRGASGRGMCCRGPCWSALLAVIAWAARDSLLPGPCR